MAGRWQVAAFVLGLLLVLAFSTLVMAGLVAMVTTVLFVVALPLLYWVFRLLTSRGRTRRNWFTAARIVIKWPWVAAALGLAVVIPRDRLAWWRFMARRRRGSFIRRPIIWPMCDEYGVTIRMWTVPGVTTKLLSVKSDMLAGAWRMHRLAIHEIRPGLIDVRGLRTDPLTQPYPMGYEPGDPRRLRTGIDEWGHMFKVNLAQVPGVTIGGLSGKGKTTHAYHWLAQLADVDWVQFVFVDGKGQGDYDMWKARSWRYVESDLSHARDALRETYELMELRQSAAKAMFGERDIWRMKPMKFWPLVVVVIDECHTFFKGTGHNEAVAKQCRHYVEQLIRKGRSVLFTTVLLTQKQTADAVPTEIRDNCELGMCFPVRTAEAAVAALGDDIRHFQDMNPVNLQGNQFVGVATVNNTAVGGFARIRTPLVSDEKIRDVAAKTRHLRVNPRKALKDEMARRGIVLNADVIPIDRKKQA